MKRLVYCIFILLLTLSLAACKNQQNESDADVQVMFGFEVHDGNPEENAEILKSLDEIRKTIESNPGFGMAQYEAAESVVIMKPRYTYLADKDGTMTGQVVSTSNYVIVGDGEYLCSVGVSRRSDGKIEGVAFSATIEEGRSEALKNCCKDNKNRKTILYYPPDGTQPVEFDDENAADSTEDKVFCVLKDTRGEKGQTNKNANKVYVDKDNSYLIDFEVIENQVVMNCHITITNKTSSEKTLKISANSPEDVLTGLLKSENMKVKSEDGQEKLYTVSGRSSSQVDISFIGEFAGNYQKHDRNLPNILIEVID